MQMRNLIRVVLYVVGYGFLVPGIVVTALALYLSGSQMDAYPLVLLPYCVPSIIVGALIIPAARRYGA
jgi:hypothetical protein